MTNTQYSDKNTHYNKPTRWGWGIGVCRLPPPPPRISKCYYSGKNTRFSGSKMFIFACQHYPYLLLTYSPVIYKVPPPPTKNNNNNNRPLCRKATIVWKMAANHKPLNRIGKILNYFTPRKIPYLMVSVNLVIFGSHWLTIWGATLYRKEFFYRAAQVGLHRLHHAKRVLRRQLLLLISLGLLSLLLVNFSAHPRVSHARARAHTHTHTHTHKLAIATMWEYPCVLSIVKVLPQCWFYPHNADGIMATIVCVL